MFWLKQHWKILAGIAVGIPVLYWLYTYAQAQSAANAATSAQNAQNASLQNQIASQQQAVALANLSSNSAGGVAGTSQPFTNPSTTSNPTVTASSDTTSTVAISATAPAGTISGPSLSATSWYGEDPAALAAGMTAEQWDVQQANQIVPTSPGGSSTTPVSTLFGTGPQPAGDPFTAPKTTTPISGSLTRAQFAPVSSGEIPQHNTTLPTPNTFLSSVGGRTA